MPVFLWKARTRQGTIKKGELEAANDAAVMAQLRAQMLVPVTVKRGQVSFHHCWTVHSSEPNYSPHPRLVLVAHMQPGTNGYTVAHDENGNVVQLVDELLCRRRPDGTPDFADPSVFPRRWPLP